MRRHILEKHNFFAGTLQWENLSAYENLKEGHSDFIPDAERKCGMGWGMAGIMQGLAAHTKNLEY